MSAAPQLNTPRFANRRLKLMVGILRGDANPGRARLGQETKETLLFGEERRGLAPPVGSTSESPNISERTHIHLINRSSAVTTACYSKILLAQDLRLEEFSVACPVRFGCREISHHVSRSSPCLSSFKSYTYIGIDLSKM